MFVSSSFQRIVILQEESSKEESSSEREESDSDSESEGGEGVRIVYKQMVSKCQSYFWRANVRSRGSCTVDLSP